MISVAEALQHILQHAAPLAVETVATSTALGAVLAEEIASDGDVPPWDKSLVDGYAVRAEDVTPGASLTILEQVAAGQVPTRAITPGHATQIMTGAPIPPGADAVVMIERSQQQGEDRVSFEGSARAGQNILRRGAVMRCGEVVLTPGRTLRAIELGLLAEVGRTQVPVVRRPRVAVLSTGDELVEPEQSPQGAQIRNSNGTLLAALVQSSGAEVLPLGIAKDNVDELRAKITAGLTADVLILSGGVSAGVLDLVPQTLSHLGVQQKFHKVNLKPGKPLWFGVRANAKLPIDATLVFGLPGNPVSSLVCFGLFVRPALRQLAGELIQNNKAPRTATLTQPFTQRDDRPTYFPAVLQRTAAGDSITPLPWQGSADLKTLTAANALAYFPGGAQTFEAGAMIEVIEL